MLSSLHTLLTGIIDYAGLFPPASLPLDEAIHQYARYRHDPDRWMLGRFICPAARLGELTSFVPELFTSESPLPVSLLGRGGKSIPEFLAGLRADGDALAAFLDGQGERVEVSVYEVRLPDDLLAAGREEPVRKLLDEIARTLKATSLARLTPYFEAVMGSAWRSSASLLCTALAEENRLGFAQGRQRFGPAGLKLRCGGLEAAAFPSPEQVAFVITTCRDGGVPLKFTAGLHHPLRHFDASLQAHRHGFLNVFVAGTLAHARRLSANEVRPIIEDERVENFAFADDGLRWKDLQATLGEISAARRCAVVSFGSCSFEEPRDDLRALGLLQ